MHVAKAESKVHGLPLTEVHFHEVGATDSIVDIVGAAICFKKLGVDKVISTPIELGGGFVTAAHGKMPVPAPATAEIVKDIPVKYGGVDHEATTPTGAAILAELVDEFVTSADIKMLKTAYGIGHRDGGGRRGGESLYDHVISHLIPLDAVKGRNFLFGCFRAAPACQTRHHPPESLALAQAIEGVGMGAGRRQVCAIRWMVIAPGLAPRARIIGIGIVIPVRVVTFNIGKIEQYHVVVEGILAHQIVVAF